MATNEYVYTRFISTSLRSILLAPAKASSPRERVRMILDHSFSIKESDLPKGVRNDWQVIAQVKSTKVPDDLKWMASNNAKVCGLSTTQARKVLASFWNIAGAVISKRSR
jgi:hypothetical protein